MSEQAQTPAKPAGTSLTVWSLAIAAAPVIAQATGLATDEVSQGIGAVMTLVGIGSAFYGRSRAAGALRWPWQSRG